MVIKDIKRDFYYGGRNYRGATVWTTSCESAKHYKSEKGASRGFGTLVHQGVRLADELKIEA